MTDLELDQQFARRRDAARRITDAERADARAVAKVQAEVRKPREGRPGATIAFIGDTTAYPAMRVAAKAVGCSDMSIRRSIIDGRRTVGGRVWIRVTPALWKLWQAVGGPLSREMVREAQATGRAA